MDPGDWRERALAAADGRLIRAVESARLTKREKEVLTLVIEGKTNSQIAEHLIIARSTVKTHLEHVYEKLEVHNRAAAVAHVLREGLG